MGSNSTYIGYLWPFSVQSHFGVIHALAIFRNLGLMIREGDFGPNNKIEKTS